MASNKANYILFGILGIATVVCLGVGFGISQQPDPVQVPPSVAVSNPYVPTVAEPEPEPVVQEYNGNDLSSGTSESGVEEVRNIDARYRYPSEYSVTIDRFSDGFIQELSREGEPVKEAILNLLSQYCNDIGANADIFHFDENSRTQFDNHVVYNIRGAGSVIHIHVAGLDSVVACIE